MWLALLAVTLPSASQNPLAASVSCAYTVLTHGKWGYAPGNLTRIPKKHLPSTQVAFPVPFARASPGRSLGGGSHTSSRPGAAPWRMDVGTVYVCGGDPRGSSLHPSSAPPAWRDLVPQPESESIADCSSHQSIFMAGEDNNGNISIKKPRNDP